jgi:hypothetical protein
VSGALSTAHPDGVLRRVQVFVAAVRPSSTAAVALPAEQEHAAARTTFLIEDYKLKVGWMTSHYDRVMRRLQMFLTLETALAAVLIITQTGELSPAAPYIAFLQVCLSAVWLAVGRSDRHLMRLHIDELRRVGKLLCQDIGVDAHPAVSDLLDDRAHPCGLRERVMESSGNAQPPYGAASIPAMLLAVWIAVLALLLFVV